jgi:hypothetical protein
MRRQTIAEKSFPDLRQDYDKFKSAESSDEAGPYGFMFIEADRMTNSLNTLREQIFAWRRERSHSGQ